MVTNSPDSKNMSRNHRPRASRKAWHFLAVALAVMVVLYVSRDQLLLMYMRWRATDAIVGCRGSDSPFVYYRLSRPEVSRVVGQIIRSTSGAEFNKTNIPVRLSIFLFDSNGECFGRILVKAAYGSPGDFIDNACKEVSERNAMADGGSVLSTSGLYHVERSCN